MVIYLTQARNASSPLVTLCLTKMRLFLLGYFCLATSASALVAQSLAALTEIPSQAFDLVETDPSGIKYPWRVFKSSAFTPPYMNITGNGGPLAEGYVFMTPQTISITAPTDEENGGFIMTSSGDLVFAQNTSGMTDFRKQYYDGKPYLTYWSGYNTNGANTGHGYGQVNFVDETYKNLSVDPNLGINKLTSTPVANWSIDIHEHQMTPRNTLLVSAYNNTPYDLTSVGGPADGWIVDAMVFELNITTRDVLFSWRAAEHVPLNASHQQIVTESGNATKAAPWDWFHINAIEALGENYLVNSRHTWTTFLISGKDGSVTWSLEGQSGGSFGPLPSNGTFKWQHHARAHNVTESRLDLSLFDNHNQILDNGTAPSRALVYHLEFQASASYTPQLLRKLETPSEELYADSQGSYTVDLSNGNQFVGYGQIAISREYGPGPDGSDLRWQAQFGGINTVQSYRGFKETWHGTLAAWDPSLVVESGKAYVSWNGATDVTSWNVYTGQTSTKLKCVGAAAKKGFETVFEVPAGAQYVQVAAIQDGKEVRKSNISSVKGLFLNDTQACHEQSLTAHSDHFWCLLSSTINQGILLRFFTKLKR